MITLHPHQQTAIDTARKKMMRSKSVLFVAATGFGKTIVAAFIVKKALEKQSQVMFLTHRIQLTDQTSNTMRAMDISHSFIASGYAYNPYARFHIATIGTVARRLKKLHRQPNIVIVDEAHLCLSATYRKALDHFKEQGAWIIGLTGSPIRLSGEPMSDMFDDIVRTPSTRWLIENGWLSDYRLFAPYTPDVKGVRKIAGDYSKAELERKLENDTKRIGSAVENYRKHAYGMRMIAFAISCDDARNIVQKFINGGIPAGYIDGETPKNERREIIRKLADGEIKILVNVQICTEGFDLSAQIGREVPIDGVILLRPTKSLALYLQMVGRGLRKKPYPAIILDHAGNCYEHGLPCEERDWDLDAGTVKKQGYNSGGVRVKQCLKCYRAHYASPSCPNCGYVYVTETRDIKEEEGELGEVDKNNLQKISRQEQGQAQSLDDLIKLGRKRNYKNPTAWAAKVLSGRMQKRRA